MIIDNQSNKEIMASILLGILRFVPIKEKYDNELYKIELQKKLKFKHIDDPNLFRGCIDLLEDTEFAILDYQKFGLGNKNRTNEKYLRLYGVLNAVYQQIIVIVELADLFNCQNPNKTEVRNNLKGLKIFELRNKLAAHTINFKYDLTKKASKENIDFFRLAQTSIKGWGEDLLVVSNKKNPERFNLKDLLSEYNNYADKILINICKKSIHSIFSNDGENKKWLLRKLNSLES